MEERKGDRNHVYAKMLLSCIVPLLACAGVDGSESAGQTTKDGPTTAVAPSNAVAVALEEMPVWDLTNERVRASFLTGQHAYVRVLGKGEVLPGRRPEFTSDAPLYGEVSFPASVEDSRASGRMGFALDCSRKGGDYDLLYFDENRDADLTNDKVRKPAPQSERLAWRDSSIKETYFEPVAMAFDFGPAGQRTLELLPCLRIYEGSPPQFRLVAVRVHHGRFKIDGTAYEACVGYQYLIRGRLDEPSTTLILTPEGEAPVLWWDGDTLSSVHRLGGRFRRFACTPTGDRLFVRPYEGPVGTFEIGAGGRKVEKLEARGSLRSKDMAVAVGGSLMGGWPEPARRCEIPVGDYYPLYMTVTFGELRITISNNYHTNTQGQSRPGRAPVHGIAIRPDKPYVLDFSNRPAVIFTEPQGAAEREFPVGDVVTIKAVLVDPALDIMIRGLNDMSRAKKETFKTPDGKEQTYSRPPSLDPKVVIKRSNGEIVAEGVMPFG